MKENKSVGEQLVKGMKEVVEHSEGKLDLRTSVVEEKKLKTEEEMKILVDEAMENASKILAENPELQKEVEAASQAILSNPIAKMVDTETLNEIGKALHDALQLLPPGGSVRKTVEKAYALYLEKAK